ncbi:hypothetical protein ACPYPG_20810 [Streptomyces sp. FR-108]|uniref:hypothetical protein n=1 Tax=Streptomyces sp. FR-108 TaxID=3416665 RepID=UPI003CF738C5
MGPHIRHVRGTRRSPHARNPRTAPVAAVSATAASPRFPTGVTLRGSRPAVATLHRFLPDGLDGLDGLDDPADPDPDSDPAPCHAPDPATRRAYDLHVAQSSGPSHGPRAAAVRDDLGPVCELADERQYDSARIVKALIMKSLLRRAGKLRIRTRAYGLGRRRPPQAPCKPQTALSGEPDRPAPYEPLPGRDEPEPGATP